MLDVLCYKFDSFLRYFCGIFCFIKYAKQLWKFKIKGKYCTFLVPSLVLFIFLVSWCFCILFVVVMYRLVLNQLKFVCWYYLCTVFLVLLLVLFLIKSNQNSLVFISMIVDHKRCCFHINYFSVSYLGTFQVLFIV